VDLTSMWFNFRPDQKGCHLDDDDVAISTAKVMVSSSRDRGELIRGEARRLEVLAIFGAVEEVASGDAGVKAADDELGAGAFYRFVARTRAALGSAPPVQIGSEWNQQLSAPLHNGMELVVNALFVGDPASGRALYPQLNELLARADLIVFRGHPEFG